MQFYFIMTDALPLLLQFLSKNSFTIAITVFLALATFAIYVHFFDTSDAIKQREERPEMDSDV